MPKIIKENKILYYVKSYLMPFLPIKNYKREIQRLEKKLSKEDLENAQKRVDYYCKIKKAQLKISGKTFIKNLKQAQDPKTYYFDAYKYARFFDENLKMDFVFGDVIEVPQTPSLVKSRPIAQNNENSVLFKLNYARHFRWIENDKGFYKKKDQLFGRGAIFENHHNRIAFFREYFNHPFCNLGQTNDFGDFGWKKPKASIEEHLDYNFILSLQGNDVATNLKWIMSSNSIAVMPKPTIETWFMEGILKAGKHYIEIKEDFSDLEEKLKFYIAQPQLCFEIIKNANEYCRQFQNENLEDYCCLKVLEKYLKN